MDRADHPLQVFTGAVMVFAGLLSVYTAVQDGKVLAGWTAVDVFATVVGCVQLFRAWRAHRSTP